MQGFKYHKDILWRSAESALIEGSMSSLGVVDLRKLMANNFVPTRERATAMFALLKKILPASFEQNNSYRSIVYKSKKLPFNPDEYTFSKRVGRGGGCDVYLLEAQDKTKPSWVMKIDLINTNDLQVLHQRALELNQSYRKVKKIYGTIPGLVTPEYTMISSALQRGKKISVINIQQFFGNHLKDVFRVPEIEFAQKLQSNKTLADLLRAFVDVSFKHKDTEGEMLDVLGPNCLVLVTDNGQERLVIIDPHLFYSLRDIPTEKAESLIRRFDRLKKYNDAAG